MYENLKNIVGKNIEKVFLEWFYFNGQPDSIGRLYIKVDSYFDITCCEENVFEHSHNFIFYNEGYELDDTDKFEIDVNISLLPFIVIDI